MNMKSSPDISVIIPIYNVEEYLEKCLDSVLNQTKDNIEAIMVDNGSTDSSGDIAQMYAKNYENFKYYSIENNGLGNARNYGVEKAQGEYIIFLDSDDIVLPQAYQDMYELAQKNDSDMTICNVARFNSKKSYASELHKKAFNGAQTCTHVTKNHNLIYDTTSWNKLIRRSFWDKYNFSFPEHILYEDIPVTIPMHFLANNVSVVSGIGYLWRVRDGAQKSITQNASSMENLIDRITVLKMVDKFFAENVKDEYLKQALQLKNLQTDLMIFVNQCKSVPTQQAEKMLSYVREYIGEAIDVDLFDKMTLINRQKYIYVMNNDIENLVKLLEYQKDSYGTAHIIEKNGDFIAQVPETLFTVEDKSIKSELVLSEPNNYIDKFSVKDNIISIRAHAYFNRINFDDINEQKFKVYLYNEKSGVKLELDTVAYCDHDTTQAVGVVADKYSENVVQYNYDGAGFIASIDVNKLKLDSYASGIYKLLVEYETKVNNGSFYLSGIDKQLKNKYNNFTLISGNTIIRVGFEWLDYITLCVKKDNVFAKNVFCKDNKVICKIESNIESLCAQNEQNATIEFEKTAKDTFEAPFDKFEKDTQYCALANGKDEVLLRSKEVKLDDSCDSTAVFLSSKTYNVSIKICNDITVLEQANRDKKLVELIAHPKHFDNAGAFDYAVMYIDDDISQSKVVLAKATAVVNGNEVLCKYSIDFKNKDITKNLYQSIRDVFVEYHFSDGRRLKEYVYCTDYFKFNFKYKTLVVSFYRSTFGYIRLRSTQVWEAYEDTPQKRKALTLKNYPKYREEKLNPKRIVFESMWGSKYSCNPQHLYEYIDKYYPEYECIWSLNDARTPIKGDGIRVRRGSQKYYYYLATAKYFVNNVNFETDYVKRDGQIEIQTMHGTPLKTLGLDVDADFPTNRSRELYIEKNSRWNYLIVQSDFMVEKAKACFMFEKEYLKTGYPRTDILFDDNAYDNEKIKEAIGIPKDKKVVLYLPTWRVKNRFNMQLDLEQMREKLGDDYVILVRIHHFCANGYTVPADNEFIFDLTAYRCVEELYRISDIMITDYSSVMFDFALLNKPMIFYTYDLEEYSEELRGLYVDIVKEAPGPLVYDTSQVIDVILNIASQTEKCSDRIDSFKKKYLTYECGNSCEKVVQEVFKPTRFSNKMALKKRKIKNALKPLRNHFQ